jgi:two-component system, cell cycle sensor histidine kinase and response regulator CckA
VLSKYFRRTAKAIRLRGPLADNPTARVLNTLLVGVLCWLVFDVAVIIPLLSRRKPAATAEAAGVGLIFAIALALLHRGSLRAASLFYLSAIWLLATVVIILNGGIHSTFVVFYVVLPISAAWLLGYGAALLMAGICLASSLTMAALEMNGIPLPPSWGNGPLGTWATLVWAMIIAAVPVAQVLQILKEALIQSESAKKTLQESEERFRRMADTAPVMIWVSGPDKGCTFFNKVWLEFTGRTMDQELGSGWTEGIHPSDAHRCVAAYSESFDVRNRFQIEYRLRRADGTYRWVLGDAVPRFSLDGTFAGYIGSCIDITETKRTQEEALKHQKLESVGLLARGIAHDFNNLLGGILSTTELALSDRKSGSFPEEELVSIRKTAVRGGEIVRQLLTYSGEQSLVFELVDLSSLVAEMLQLLKVSISKHAILETDLGDGLPGAYGNPAQLRQIVMNLITNASDAIGENRGCIRVTIRPVKVGQDERVMGAAPLASGDYLKLVVSDTGPGVPPEIQARIFDPFFTTKSTGHGLGLSVVQGIVHRHRGAISVASPLGDGTCFEILLPCAGQRPEATTDLSPQSAIEQTPDLTGTVLVVEDEDVLRVAISRMIRRTGLVVIESTDGFDAVEQFRANQRDIAVVLLDMTLPGMKGHEVFAELRRIRPDIKVIITSAYSQEMALDSLGGQPAWAFIRKPFQIKELVNLLREACRENRRASGRAATSSE